MTQIETARPNKPRGRGPSLSSDAARAKIIESAERLFADGGINGVSLREIAARAGQKNHFAVQYHFGSREGLVQAIFDTRMLEMEPERGRMLAAAAEQGTLGDPRRLLDIVYLPQLELTGVRGKGGYAAFLAQYLLGTRSREFGVFSSGTPEHLTRTLKLLRASVGHLTEAAAQRRLVSCSLMFLHMLVEHDQGNDHGAPEEPFETALEDTLDQMTQVLTAPMASR